MAAFGRKGEYSMRKFDGFQRGVNLGGWLSQCVARTKEHFDSFITEDDIRKIRSFGLDHIRVPVDYDVFMNEQEGEDTVNSEGIRHIDDCIGWCCNSGLNMILDLHKAKGYMFDANEVEDGDRFFRDEALQEVFYRTWEMFAVRYGKYSDMLAFELLNEVVNPDLEAEWNRIATKAIERIRAIAPESYIIVGGVNYNNVLSVPGIDIPIDDRIIINFHCYEPLCFTHQKAYWVDGMTENFEAKYPADIEYLRQKSTEFSKSHAGAIFDKRMDGDGSFFEKMFEPAIKYATDKNVPLYCGEYGVIDRAPLADTLNWVRDIHTSFEKFGIGRALWNYKNKDFGLVDEHYAPILDEMVKEL